MGKIYSERQIKKGEEEFGPQIPLGSYRLKLLKDDFQVVRPHFKAHIQHAWGPFAPFEDENSIEGTFTITDNTNPENPAGIFSADLHPVIDEEVERIEEYEVEVDGDISEEVDTQNKQLNDQSSNNTAAKKNQFGFSGPLRPEIKYNTKLSQTKKDELQWDKTVEAFKQTNPGIPADTLNEWIKKSLGEGWTLDVDAAPAIRQTFVASYDENGIPIIESYSYPEAFAYANKIKRESQSPQQKIKFTKFRWQTRILKTIKFVSGTDYATNTEWNNVLKNNVKGLPEIDFQGLANITGALEEGEALAKKSYYVDKLRSPEFVSLTLAVQQKLYPNNIELWTGVFDAQTRKDAEPLLKNFTSITTTLTTSYSKYSNDEQYQMAVYNGYVGNQKDFSSSYGGSFLKFMTATRPDLIALNNGTIVDDYGKSIHEGFKGGIYGFYLVYEGKYDTFKKLNDSYQGMFVIDPTKVNNTMNLAKTNGNVITAFRNLVFDTAIERLNNNQKNLRGWKTYVANLGAENLKSTTQASVYQGYKQSSAENDKTWMLEYWLQEPDPGRRKVYENFMDGTFKGGCQYCHSKVQADLNAFTLPDTKTPLQQLIDAKNIQTIRMAPITFMSTDTLTGLRSGFSQLPSAQTSGTGSSTNQESNSQGQTLNADQVNAIKNWVDAGASSSTTSNSTTANTTTSPQKNTFSQGPIIYPNIQQADENVDQLNGIMSVLGPYGFQVVPMDIFTQGMNRTDAELRKVLQDSIDLRIDNFEKLKGRINEAKNDPDGDVLKFWHLGPVMNDLLGTISDVNVKTQIQDYLDQEKLKENITQVADMIAGILLMLIPIPGIQLLGAMYFFGKGVDMMKLGSTLSLGVGAPNVMDRSLAASGDAMFLMGAMTAGMAAIGIAFSGAAVLREGVVVQVPSTSEQSSLPGTSRQIVQGDYTVQIISENELVVTNAEMPGCYMSGTRTSPSSPFVFKGWKFNRQTGLWEEMPPASNSSQSSSQTSTNTNTSVVKTNNTDVNTLPNLNNENVNNLPTLILPESVATLRLKYNNEVPGRGIDTLSDDLLVTIDRIDMDRFKANPNIDVKLYLELKKEYDLSDYTPIAEKDKVGITDNEISSRFGEEGLKLAKDSEMEANRLAPLKKVNKQEGEKANPVLSAVRGPIVDQTFFGQNIEPITDLDPFLQARLDRFETAREYGLIEHQDIQRASIPGTHSEIVALNKAIKAHKRFMYTTELTEAEFEQFLLMNRNITQVDKISQTPPRCINCFYLTKGVKVISSRTND